MRKFILYENKINLIEFRSKILIKLIYKEKGEQEMKKRFLTLCLAATLALTTVQGSVMIYASEQNSETAEPASEEITGVFEYLGNMTMADGSRQVADLLFIQAPEAEDGVYVYDIATGELYDHINHKKVAEEFETMEHCINTLANCYEHYASGEAIMWMDSEIILPMTEEEIQEVLAVLG